MKRMHATVLGAAVLAMLAAAAATGQVVHHHHYYSGRPWAAHVIVPQARVTVHHLAAAAAPAPRPSPHIEITAVEVGVVIVEQTATTTMDIALRNRTGSRQEAELVMPVPQGAVVRTFTFQGAAAEPKAELLAKEAAASAYNAIVAKARDPALLEFVGYNLVRSAVFPLEANGTQKVRLTYEHLLPADGSRVDYELPRSESIDYTVPWSVSVRIKSKRPVSTVYSPSHRLEVKRAAEGIVSARIAPEATQEPGAFRLSYLLEGEGVSASLLAYPDPKPTLSGGEGAGGGYFLLLAGVPASLKTAGGKPAIKREVTLVLDRSGSMRGEKIEQVREAALQVVEGLEDGEAFNLLVYNEAVDLFAPKAVVKSAETIARARAYLADVKPRGGTNIHDALLEALRTKPLDGMLPIVLFLTDGLPTIGQTSEAAIRDVALKANPHGRRIFTFGVGLDVNTPLLDKIAAETRATATFVLPKEDVEVKVAQVFKRLAGPVLADPQLDVTDDEDSPPGARVADLCPAKVPDLFEDDQLVLLGRYKGEKPVTFVLSGNYLGRKRTFRFKFDLAGATTRNAFVPRLWASRKIAVLLDAIRQMGAAAPAAGVPVTAVSMNDPRLKELVDEVVRLSTEFGILTEYTAFLAREGTDLSRKDEVLAEAVRNFNGRAIQTRSGLASVNQEFNNDSQRRQGQLNYRNGYWDENMNRVEVSRVQQVNDRAFYNRNGRWVDSRVVEREAEARPARVIEFGSEEYQRLVQALAGENRNGIVSLQGDILMVVDGQTVLVKGPGQ
jgi:Ca-activated chloride channel family protein